ncbi:MAG TPA: signal recognition particle-docking protein FtsY [Candidatus Poseidoniaceae archaeon]|nr:MAG TPA: signal recognition particle-docking protein FtsY [Candidatus Poseidoniales archaeon]HIH52875.1 signal recognition particle-docking protein FtsY [Candidatus Poseidoniaceae archaeon]
MGLFNRFRRRVKETVDASDAEGMLAEDGSEEAKAALLAREEAQATPPPTVDEPPLPKEEDWEDPEDDDWEEPEDDWEDPEDDWELPEEEPAPTPAPKPRRGTPAASKVELRMMRSTTGRQLVEVAHAPRGSSVEANITTESGDDIRIDLGGGVVSEGGRVIKSSKALDNLLEELEWALLESDVSSDAVSGVVDALRNQLVGARLRRGADLAKVLEASLKRALRSLLEAGYWDFDATVAKALEAGDAPVVIMLVGVNGTGKTTTTAKLAHRLMAQGHSVIAAAGDTFRAGAIQQLEQHCENLGVRCISSQRGGDSAAIARDAIASAKAKDIDVVLVDTAGRMQNKTNLMNELAKVRRVADPHLTLFVGDSLAGNDAVEQARMFQSMLQFDGAVLTKLDTDAKGGAGLSIAFATGRPIVFAGMGQGYEDLTPFDPDWLIEEIFE